ncbi:hypothetical protein D3C86_2164630 [compost metagenome]
MLICMEIGANRKLFKPEMAIREGAQRNNRLKAFEKASTVSYPYLKAISVTVTLPPINSSAAQDRRRNRTYSITE